MITNIPLLSCIALSLFAFCRFILLPAFISPLSKVPNAHWSASLSPIWILWTRYRCRENRTVHAAHLKLGPVIRLGPNELSINDLAGLRTVYGGGFEKGRWYSIFNNYGVPCMFSSWDSRTHSARKRMISSVYSKSNIHSSSALAKQAQVVLYERLLPTLCAASTNSKPAGAGIEIHELWNATTMDSVTAYLFGLENGSKFLRDEKYRRHWLSLYHSRKTYPYFSQELPRLTRFLKALHIYLVPRWVDDANDELEAWCKARCEESSLRLSKATLEPTDPVNDPVVFRTVLAGIEKEEKSKGTASVLQDTTLQYKELSIASEMIDHLAAGHETSAITLTYIVWYLSQNLELQDGLRVELQSLTPNMTLPSKELPNSKDLDSLPLLNAVLMETLRLNAAIPGGQPRITPYPSTTIGTFTNIPGGVRIGAQAHSVHRNPEVFPSPEVWDHERWMDDRNGYTEEQRKERDRWFWAFSSGGRMCVGSNFAIYTIKLAIAAMYSNFRTRIVNDDGIEQEDGYTCGPVGNKLYIGLERVS